MKIHGKVIETIPKERIVILECGKEHMYLYFQRKDFREFGPYFFDKPYLFLEVSDNKKICKNFCKNDIVTFEKQRFQSSNRDWWKYSTNTKFNKRRMKKC